MTHSDSATEFPIAARPSLKEGLGITGLAIVGIIPCAACGFILTIVGILIGMNKYSSAYLGILAMFVATAAGAPLGGLGGAMIANNLGWLWMLRRRAKRQSEASGQATVASQLTCGEWAQVGGFAFAGLIVLGLIGLL